MSMAMKYAMKKRSRSRGESGVHHGADGVSSAGEHVRSGNADMAKRDHRKVMGQLDALKVQDRQNLASGGEACKACEGGICADHGGLVGRIMSKRMSQGGIVANETEERADEMPAEYDDLVLDDHLDFHETGENSGDMDNDHDLVKRIMRSRDKRPA